MPGPGRPPKPRPGPTPRPGPVVRAPGPSSQGSGSSGGGGAGGGAPDANPELLTRGNGPEPEWIIRDFTPGMHINPTRDAIGEQDLWWMENLQPLASGNVVPSSGFGFGFSSTGATAGGIGQPYYGTLVNLGSRTVPSTYMFNCFVDGSAWITPTVNLPGTQIMPPATLSNANNTYACGYTGSARLGFLIIDPNGYWDYNITAANTLTKIGTTVGTSIATYAGRVWIGNNNTLSFTDVNSYNSFAGAGGSATLSDQYLIEGITVLYAANNYLYIFGATSVDILSNVVVNAGVTSFSRVNALQGLGCTYSNNMTVIGYSRGVAFLDVTGFYLLAGATPERISERIQGCIRAAFGIDGPTSATRPSCGLVNLNRELCLVLQLSIADTFSHPTTQVPSGRIVVFVYQRHRWWIATDQFGNAPGLYNPGPLSGGAAFAGNFGVWRLENNLPGSPATWNLAQLFTGVQSWQLRTKLWDGGRAFTEKQAVNIAIGGVWKTPGPAQATNVTVTVDSELQNSTAITIPNIPTAQVGQYNYALQVVESSMAQTQTLGSQYIGLTFFGAFVITQQMQVLEVIALRGKQERNMLE